jgi:tetratricopeptide (TPR) repeat protein
MDTSLPPNPADLMAKYLDRQAGAQRAGLAVFDAGAEVLPFDAGPVQAVDPGVAWEAAMAAVPLLAPQADLRSWKAPPDWPQLVAAQEPVVAVAFCIGNYPQMMRDLHLILHKSNLRDLIPVAGRPQVLASVEEFAQNAATKKQFPAMLLALGCLRLAKQFDTATRYLQEHEPTAPQEWRAAWANEKAAVAWHRGNVQDALNQWQAQEPTVPILFNRGMAALFLGKPDDAKHHLTQAVDQLPEAGAWHHLGRLYLALVR